MMGHSKTKQVSHMHHAPAILIWLDRVASGNTVLARGKERVRHVEVNIFFF